MNVEELGVDMITLDAQKMYGPKGIGCLFVRDGIKIIPMMLGGGQEKGMRSGTENIPLVVGFAKALEITEKIKGNENARLEKIRDEFFEEIKKMSEIVINGDPKNRLPNNMNISVLKESGMLGEVDGEQMVLRFDELGIVCSSASACASGSGTSEVVLKISGDSMRAKNTLRFTMGRETKKSQLFKALKILKLITK